MVEILYIDPESYEIFDTITVKYVCDKTVEYRGGNEVDEEEDCEIESIEFPNGNVYTSYSVEDVEITVRGNTIELPPGFDPEEVKEANPEYDNYEFE